MFNVIVAACEGWGIGRSGGLPWSGLRKEMKYFAAMTRETKDPDKKNAVVMGRKTYESIPPKHRPLKGRLNMVLTRQDDYDLGCNDTDEAVKCKSLEDAVSLLASRRDRLETLWVIGGSSLYRDVLEGGLCDKVYLTRVLARFDGCDAFFPDVDARTDFRLLSAEEVSDPRVPSGVQSENGVDYQCCVFQKI